MKTESHPVMMCVVRRNPGC